MNLVLWIMTGATIGVIIGIVSPLDNRGGLLGASILGAIGAILGGFTANVILNTSLFTFNFQSYSLAILGAISLLGVGKFFSTDITRFHKYES